MLDSTQHWHRVRNRSVVLAWPLTTVQQVNPHSASLAPMACAHLACVFCSGSLDSTFQLSPTARHSLLLVPSALVAKILIMEESFGCYQSRRFQGLVHQTTSIHTSFLFAGSYHSWSPNVTRGSGLGQVITHMSEDPAGSWPIFFFPGVNNFMFSTFQIILRKTLRPKAIYSITRRITYTSGRIHYNKDQTFKRDMRNIEALTTLPCNCWLCQYANKQMQSGLLWQFHLLLSM